MIDRIPFLAKLKAELAPLHGKEKLEYLWMYYKAIPLLLVGALVVVWMIVNALLPDTSIFGGGTVNTHLPDEGIEYITYDWFLEMGGVEGKDSMVYETVNFKDPATTVDETNYYSAMRPIVLAANSELDYLIVDKGSLDFIISQVIFLDVRDVLTPEQQALFEETYLYGSLGNVEDMFPFALDVTDLPFFQHFCPEAESLYLMFPQNAPRAQLLDDFLQHLIDWTPAGNTD